MNMNRGFCRLGVISLLIVAIASAGLMTAGCTGDVISRNKARQLHKDVQTRGLIIGFEGLQPWSGHRADDLTRKVAKELGLGQPRAKRARSSRGHN